MSLLKRNIGPGMMLLICLNSMSGAGVFVNAKPISFLAGKLGFLSYLIGMIIMLPVVLSLAEMAQANPVAGGLYQYSKNFLGKSFGFFSAWSYFLSKSVSVAVLTQAFTTPLAIVLAPHIKINKIVLDGLVLSSIIASNLVGVRLGGKIQWVFTVIKAIPYSAIILSGAFLSVSGKLHNFNTFNYGQSFFSSLPITIFALSGFEISSTIAHMVKDPEKTIKKVAVSSFLLVGLLYSTFQLCAQILSGPALATHEAPFLLITQNLSVFLGKFASLIHDLIKLATISAAFGILTNNCWNLYAIAKDELVPFSKYLVQVNRNDVPWICLLIEGLLSLLIMSLTTDQIALQSMSVFSTCIAYTLSTAACFVYLVKSRASWTKKTICTIGIFSCCLIVFLSALNIVRSGLSASFLGIFIFGIILVLLKSSKQQNISLMA